MQDLSFFLVVKEGMVLERKRCDPTSFSRCDLPRVIYAPTEVVLAHTANEGNWLKRNERASLD